MSDLLPVVFDLETTHKEHQHAAIVQVAAVVCKEDQLPFTLFSSYCNPGITIPEEAKAIHHISDEMVRWAPTPRIALQTMAILLKKVEEQTGKTIVLAGHNIDRYDIPIIKRVLPKAFDNYDTLDTYSAVMRLYPSARHKLSEAFEDQCNETPIDAHDAAADCMMCAQLIGKFIHDSNKSLHDFVEWLIDPVVLDVWPLGKYKGQPSGSVPTGYLRWCQANFNDPQKDIELTISKLLSA